MESIKKALEGGNQDQVMSAYKALLDKYPTNGLLWIAYCQYLYGIRALNDLEKAFGTCLRSVLDVRLWKIYLQHVVAVNAHNDDPSIIVQAFEFAVSSVGLDVESFPIWHEYIEVLKAVPGLDASIRTDMLRKIYIRALQIPMEGLESLWSQYDAFEQSTNRLTAKKMIAEKSLMYMTARSQIKSLLDLSVLSVNRNFLPIYNDERGDIEEENNEEVLMESANWLRWILWERTNPLGADKAIVNARVMYAFRKALMTMRHQPVLWMAMVEFCEEQMIALTNSPWFGKAATEESLSLSLLRQAVEANRTSLTLTLALTERLECDRKNVEKNQEGIKGLFEGLISSLESKLDSFPDFVSLHTNSKQNSGKLDLANRLSLAYVHWMAQVRRSEGLPAARAIFTKARKHPLCGPAVYASSAWMEYWHGSKDEKLIASRIFELGMAKFATWSVDYVLEYATFLQSIKDDVNLRAVLEKAIIQLGKDRNLPLWKCYLKYESRMGDMVAVKALEKRLLEQHPTLNTLDLFQHRNESMQLDALEGAAARKLASLPLDPNTLPTTKSIVPNIPGWIPNLVMQLLVRLNCLPISENYDGPVVKADMLFELLSKYPPPIQQALPNSSSSYSTTTSNGKYVSSDKYGNGTSGNGISGERYSSSSVTSSKESKRPQSSISSTSSSRTKSRHNRSTYEDVFDDDRDRKRRK